MLLSNRSQIYTKLMEKNIFKIREKIRLFLYKIKITPLSFLLILIIFFLAFIPRSFDLGTGLTYDEQYWLIRAPSFFNAVIHLDFVNTIKSGHPGVTTMWLSGIFMKLFSDQDMLFPHILTIARFPVALVTSLGILAMYFLLKELFSEKIALLGVIFIALDPFYIAHSRLIHLDALLTTFMVLSFLSLLVYLVRPEKAIYLFLAGIFLGLALLTKLPSFILIPIFILTLLIWYLINDHNINHNFKKIATDCSKIVVRIFKPLFIVLSVAVFVFILLWPVMWVNPIYAEIRVAGCLFNVLTTPHFAGFLLGAAEDTSSFGALFYPLEILIKITPLTFIFPLFCISILFYNICNKKFSKENLIIISLIFFIFIFTLVMTFAQKKFDRYLLPIFPLIDILAAVGVYYFYSIIAKRLDSIKVHKKTIFKIFLVFILVFQISLLLPIAPYYLSYSNPIMYGGPKNAPNITLIGWGEGNDLAAEYLNQKPNPENITVWAEYYGFEQYFKGKTISLPLGTATKNNTATSDYLVFYVCAVQRHLDDDLWNTYKNQTPEKKITLNDIDYCWIYQTNSGSL